MCAKSNDVQGAAIIGRVQVDNMTKRLIPRLKPKQIAVIAHKDLDEVAASGLIDAKVTAVINAKSTMSGRYPTKGASLLLAHGIPIYEIDEKDFAKFVDGMRIVISGKWIDSCKSDGWQSPIACKLFTWRAWNMAQKEAESHLHERLEEFIENTLYYAHKEKDAFIERLHFPQMRTVLNGKHVLIVVRGSGFKQDLTAIRHYIEDYKPVLIGVDGGADALLSSGYVPQMIIGDMDSVSNEALQSGAELVVHAYPEGHAPGLVRVQELGLNASLIPAPGISEDIAMLLAYEHHAEMIVTLGAHTHMIDFLEKGRKGMASTMLVRMKIGSKLIDAKGVSKLYHRKVKWRNVWIVPAAGFFPLLTLALIHPGFRHFMDMVWLYMKLSVTS